MRRALLVVGIALALVAAAFCFAKLRLATLRTTEDVAVTVATPGRSAVEAEHEVAIPLERALAGVKGLEELRVAARGDVVVATLRVTTIGADATPATELVRDAVSGALRTLPQDVMPPTVQRLDTSATAQHFVARASTLSRDALSGWIDGELRRALEVQQGVHRVETCGTAQREVWVWLDERRLGAMGVTAREVISSLQSGSLFQPIARTVEDLSAREVKTGISVRDIAALSVDAPMPECAAFAGGQSVVLVSVSHVGELRLLERPDVTLTPFAPVTSAKLRVPPGTSRDATHRVAGELARSEPDAVVAVRGEELTVMSPRERAIAAPPGLALSSVGERPSVVRVACDDFDVALAIAEKVRGALSTQAGWTAAPWPVKGPQLRYVPRERGRVDPRELADLMQLATTGTSVGRLADGTTLRVRGAKLEDARLSDGRPLREAFDVVADEAPVEILRVNGQRVVEVATSVETQKAMRAIATLPLPPGVSVSIQPARE